MMDIEYQDKKYTKEEIYNTFNPYVQEWWEQKFDNFTPPQEYGIYNIHTRQNTLISSPTGSGKTLSAFMAIINELVDLAMKDKLEDRLYCTYMSPLKALGNDIEKNLREPLEEINEIYKEDTGEELGIRIGVRTGDTTKKEKRDMRKNPPHIYITTPESFAITLTTKKFIENLKDVEWVIVDEIHSLADNKRGVHMSLSMERLEQHTQFCRIGLSATVSPLKEVAKFLVGYENPDENRTRGCKIIDVTDTSDIDIEVISPVEDLINTEHEKVHAEMYKQVNELIQNHRTTLIFTNTRSATERVVHNLKNKFPDNYTRLEEEEGETENLIGAHHGSLSQDHRLEVENKLKTGELKAVVSSTSLELGIDIGYIDLVIQLGSPKSVARALQRIGRSGHKLHQQSKGKIIVSDRDDLVECAVLMKASVEGKIDRIQIPTNVTDVLAQQIFGISLEEKKEIDHVFDVVRGSYCFKNLSRTEYDEVLDYLSGEYVSLEERNVYAKIWTDEDTGMMGKRGRLARVIYMTNVGTIPDSASVKVKLDGDYIGSVSEQFLEMLKKGDIFVLGGDTYEFRYAQGMTAFVRSASGKKPTVPSWFSEMLPLSYDLAMDIQKFRRYMEQQFEMNADKEQILDYIHDYLYLDENAAKSIYEYFKEQYLFSEIPHDKKIVVEKYTKDDEYYYIFQTLYGRRVNDVLSRAVAFVISKIYNIDVEININDNGFYAMTRKNKNIQIKRVIKTLCEEDLFDVMDKALEKTEVLKRRFRHCAARALMILRNYKGNTKSVSRQQLSSRLLISAVRDIDDDFVILREAKREVLQDLMDIKHAKDVLDGVDEEVNVVEYSTKIPSPFSFNLVTMGYTDIMKMDDKKKFLQRMHNYVLAKINQD